MTAEVRAALTDAAKHLGRREYSIAELTEKLSLRHPLPDAKEAVRLLAEAGFVSDARALEAVLHNLSEHKIVGDAEIRARLDKLGIGWEEANAIIATQVPSEMERANLLIGKKYKSPTPRAKIGRFLYSRGFDESTIESVLENLPWAEPE